MLSQLHPFLGRFRFDLFVSLSQPLFSLQARERKALRLTLRFFSRRISVSWFAPGRTLRLKAPYRRLDPKTLWTQGSATRKLGSTLNERRNPRNLRLNCSYPKLPTGSFSGTARQLFPLRCSEESLPLHLHAWKLVEREVWSAWNQWKAGVRNKKRPLEMNFS